MSVKITKSLELKYRGWANRESYTVRLSVRDDDQLQIVLDSGGREFGRPLSRADAAEIVGFLTTFLLTPNQQG